MDTTSRMRNLCGCIPVRFSILSMIFVAMFCCYASKVSLGVAIVAMVNHTHHHPHRGTNHSYLDDEVVCPGFVSTNATADKTVRGKFQWNVATQSLILSSSYYGYVLGIFPSGILCSRFGGKLCLGITILLTAITTLLLPTIAYLGPIPLTLLQAFQGLAQGTLYPATNVLISKWIPPSERSHAITVQNIGISLGVVAGLIFTRILSSSNFLGGWPSAFCVFGLITCLSIPLWILLVHENPEDHPRISEDELIFIQKSCSDTQQKVTVPWKKILTSVPLWTANLCLFGQFYGYYTLMLEIPTYLYDVFHFKLAKIGSLTAVPYVLQSMFSFLATYVTGRLISNERLSTTTIRKIMNSFGCFIPAIGLFCLTFAGCRPLISIVLQTVAIAAYGIVSCGISVAIVDLSPLHTGTLTGIAYTIGNLSGFIAPIVAGEITRQNANIPSWNMVFTIAAAIFLIVGVAFIKFGSAEVQNWDSTGDESNISEEVKNENHSKRKDMECP